MSTFWKVLGIARTDDVGEIRRAYARKLKTTNPEDDPKGFMRLREAFEAAVADAEWRQRSAAYDAIDDEDQFDDLEEDGDTLIAAPAETVQAVVPAGDEAPAAEPEPEDSDLADLRAAAARLNDKLRGTWREDPATLKADFAAMLASPALHDINVRNSFEAWLADTINETVPASDPLVLPAIAAFGWDRHAVGAVNHSVGSILGHVDNWRLIQDLRAGRVPLHAGWAALTRTAKPWQRRLEALRPGLEREVRELIDAIRWTWPGLHHYVSQGAIEWWGDHLSKPRLGVSALILPMIGVLAAFAISQIPGLSYFSRLFLIGFAIGLGFAVPAADYRLFARWRLEGRVPQWLEEGWIIPLLAAPLLAILIPASQLSALLIVIVAGAAATLMFAFARTSDDGRNLRPFTLVLQCVLYLLFGALAFGQMSGAEQVIVATIGALFIAATSRVLPAIDRMMHRLPMPPLAAVILFSAVLLGLALIRTATWQLPPFPIFAPAIFAAVFGTFVAEWSGGQAGNWLARLGRIGLGLFFLALAAAAAPEAEVGGRSPTILIDAGAGEDSMRLLEKQEPAYADMRVTQPAIYESVKQVAARLRAGEIHLQAANQAIGAIEVRGYKMALPTAPTDLLVEEVELQLAITRSLRERDPVRCGTARKGQGKLDIPSELQKQMASHRVKVIAALPATESDLKRGKPIGDAELFELAAKSTGRTVKQLSDAFSAPNAPPSAKCDAQIAILSAMLQHPRHDIAATYRHQLKPPAAPGKL